MNPSLAQWVRHARGKRDIKTFADAVGVSVGTISQLETGKSYNPEWATVIMISCASEDRCNLPQLTIDRTKP